MAPSTRAFAVIALLGAACAPPRTTTMPPPPVAPPPAPTGVPGPAPAPEPEPEPAASGFRPRDVNHVLVTGQSLAVGVSGVPVTSTTQPFGNLMFATGVMAGAEDLDAFVPLVEGDNIPGSKARVETMASAFANLVSALTPEPHVLLLSNHGSGAKTYAQLKRGTRAWATGLAQVTAARDLARAKGQSYVVRAVANVHGESDHAEKSARYTRDLVAWQADFERDVRAITGQSEPVPMFVTQISSWTRMMGGTTTSAIPAAQLAAHLEARGKVILVGPKYHLPYAKDGVHLVGAGYRHLGEDHAKAYRRVVLDGGTWEPLRPLAVAREGRVITVRFAVPAPPLVLDTKLVVDPGNFGFEYTDASATPPAIEKVALGGPDSVVVILAAVPTADDRRLRYAFSGNRGARSGPETGARGNLRDSDATPSRSGLPLHNWCVHFEEAVP